LVLGVIALIGAVISRLFVVRGPARGAMAMLAGGWITALAGAIAITAKEAGDAGVGGGELLDTSIGRIGAERLIVAAVTGVGVAWAWVARRRAVAPSLPFWIAGMGGLGSLFVDVLASHADSQSIVPVNVAAQWLHVVAVAVWIGGLGALLLALPTLEAEARAPATWRFSRIATAGIIAVGVTGIYRAVIEVGSWSALTTTSFGILVIVKSGLFVLLASLGAVNHLRNVPRARLSIGALMRVGSTEMLVAVAAITAAAALVNVAPPIASQVGAAAIEPLVVSGSDLGTTVGVTLTVSPGAAGVNVFDARVRDYDTGAPVTDATSLQLTFGFAGAAATIGATTLDLRNNGGGDFSASGANLSLDGPWTVTALVERGVQSADVTLHLTTRSTPPLVRSTTITDAAGNTTVLYIVSLVGGATVECYLDPGKVGTNNDLHMTFFDAAGNGRAMSAVDVVEEPPGGGATRLNPQEFDDDPSHYISSAVPLEPGTTRFDIAGTTQAGDHLSTYLITTLAK